VLNLVYYNTQSNVNVTQITNLSMETDISALLDILGK